MIASENPFAYVSNPDLLSAEEREAYGRFWAKRTIGERFAEVNRLNRLKWGDEAFDRGMDKSKMEIVNMETGEVQVIPNKKKNP